MDYPAELVLRVNEIFHDIDASQYADDHAEIFVDEVDRWERIGRLFIANNPEKIRLLDIGSGTGFVPLQVGRFLKEEDLLICSDISVNMLNTCKKNLDKKFDFPVEYLVLDGKQIDLVSSSLDSITLNSVLHHIPDFSIFFEEVNRLMKVNSRLIIAHEPYRPFYTHRFLWNNYRFVKKLVTFKPKPFIYNKLEKAGVLGTTSRFHKASFPSKTASRRQEIAKRINDRLLEEGAIKTHLTAAQIAAIVDIHSPTAGGYHRDRGIDVSEILELYLPNYEVEYLETYRHLCKVTSANRFTKWYDAVLKRIYPKAGSTFLVVLRKSND